VNCGILIVATGEKNVAEAMPLVASIRQYMPDVTLAVVTDLTTPIEEGLFDIIDRADMDLSDVPSNHHGFMFRDYALMRTPFDYTVHIDTDTIFGASAYELFHALKRFELLVAAAPAKVKGYGVSSDNMATEDMVSFPVVPRVNCGFMAYRKSAITSGFFDHWIELYKKGIGYAARNGRPKFSDQSVFRTAIWDSTINYQMMPAEYNFRTGSPQYLDGLVRIAHGRPPMGRELFMKYINCFEGRRLYVPYKEMIFQAEDTNWNRKAVLTTLEYQTWLRENNLSKPKIKPVYANA